MGQLNPHRTVQTFIDLVARHEQAFYAFVHKVHSKGEGLFDSLMKWIELFIGLMRNGLGSPISLEFILPNTGGEERARLIREIDAVALYHYKLKLAHEDKIRRRFGHGAKGSSSEDQEEAAAQEFMADLARDMQFSDVVRGEAGDLVAADSESSSEYESDESDEESTEVDSDSDSGTGSAESVGDRAPPHSAPLPAREPGTAKGRSSLESPTRSNLGPNSGLRRHSRSFSHEPQSPAKKVPPKGSRLQPPPTQRRRKPGANVLKEPELKLLPELLPLFVELVSWSEQSGTYYT